MVGEQPSKAGLGVHHSARWNAIGKGGVQGIRFLSSLYVFSLLGPQATGLMAMALVVTGFLDHFKDFGTAQAVIQRKDICDDFLGTVFSLNLMMGFAGCGILYVLAQPIAWLFEEPEVAPVLVALGPTFLVASLGLVHRALLSRGMHFDRLAKVELLQACAHGSIAIGMAVAGYGVWSLVAAVLGSACVGAVGFWIVSDWRPRVHWKSAHLRDVLPFCANLMGFNLLNYALQNIDRIVIGRLLGTEALGLYSLAHRIVLFPVRSITQILMGVLIPALARVQDNDERYRKSYLRACAGIALVTFPMMAGIFVVADPFVRAVLDPRWIPAIPIIMLLSPIGLVRSIAGSTGAIYISKGRTDLLLRWTSILGGTTVVAYTIGTRWGIEGVAGGYAASMLLLAWPYMAIPVRLIKLEMGVLIDTLMPYAMSSAFMGIAAFALRWSLETLGLPPVGVLAGTAVGGFLLYAGAMLFARPTALKDLAAVVLPGARA